MDLCAIHDTTKLRWTATVRRHRRHHQVVERRAAAAPGLLRLGCCACGLPSKVTCGRVTKTHAHFSITFLVLTRDGSPLLFFDCGFCSVLLAVFFGFECDSSTVSLSFLFSHMTMSPFWIVLAFTSWYFLSFPRSCCWQDDITAYEYLLTFRVF